MNNQEDNTRQLLIEVLDDESFRALNAKMKQLALAEFRRARFRNRLFLITKIAAVLGLMAGAAFLARFSHEPAAKPNQTVVANQSPARIVTDEGSDFETATDKELVAQFPPNTCFVAEVEGKKMLVFNSPELRKKYLR